MNNVCIHKHKPPQLELMQTEYHSPIKTTTITITSRRNTNTKNITCFFTHTGTGFHFERRSSFVWIRNNSTTGITVRGSDDRGWQSTDGRSAGTQLGVDTDSSPLGGLVVHGNVWWERERRMGARHTRGGNVWNIEPLPPKPFFAPWYRAVRRLKKNSMSNKWTNKELPLRQGRDMNYTQRYRS